MEQAKLDKILDNHIYEVAFWTKYVAGLAWRPNLLRTVTALETIIFSPILEPIISLTKTV